MLSAIHDLKALLTGGCKKKKKKCIPSARHVVDTQQLLVELRRKHIVLAHLVHRGLGICDGLVYRKLRGADLSNLRKSQETEKPV